MPDSHALHTAARAVPVPPVWADPPPGRPDELDIHAVQQFQRLMSEEGQPVQVARMFSDRLYAYERIACAHASAHAGLRQLALALFHRCHRADERRRALS